MVIAGEWWTCDDGVVRPTLRARVQAVDGAFQIERFLVDGCADRTVLSANLMETLRLPATPAEGHTVRGIGGSSPFVRVLTVVEFSRNEAGRYACAVNSPPSTI